MTDVVSPPATHGGPTQPTGQAIAALRPLLPGYVRLDPGGVLGGWQHRNATATLPHTLRQLETSGAVDNVRRVLGRSGAEFTGMWFADSDIYKTLEAVAWELGRHADDPGGEPWAVREELGGWLADTVRLLAQAQDEDGYLNSYFQVDHRDRQWQELRGSHELYCAGHLIQAAVAAARVGVGDQLVLVARRFADLLVARYGPEGTEAVCGHPEIETALVELYRVTGHHPYLALAQRFVSMRGHGLLGVDRMGRQYYQDHLPVRDADEVTGHAVRQLYLLAGVVDVAVETGDHALLAAAERLWESAFNTKTYLTGAHGARHRDEAFGDPFELPPDRAYAETCAAIASFQWNWRMLLATGGHRYADEMERVLYNGIAVATGLDGRHFFYSNPLQLRAGHDGSNEDAPSQRLPWYSCACCPPNLARLMASLHAYLATTHGPDSTDGNGANDGAGLCVQLYGTATLRAGDAEVTMDTGYPWTGRIALRVRRAPAGPWTLALRIPGWCRSYTVRIDGVPVPAEAQDGYLRLTRHWAPDTPVLLELAMPPRLLAAHPAVDAVRGCVALTRGPLVFCFEQADLPAGVALADVRLDTETPLRVVERADPSIPVTLLARGTVSVPSPALHRDYHPDEAAGGSPVVLSAVPYHLWGNRIPGPMRVWIPTGFAG